MSIALVIQTYDEVRRLAIAGSVVAAGDFRLKKLIDPLKQSAEKAPVFGKVADAIDRLITAPDKASGPALLELGTLVHAILYTQGETGAAGNMTDLPSVDLGVQTSSQASARVLKPLMEALTTTGSGRFEIIVHAHERNAFADLRLVNLALGALDDVYPEIAEFMSNHVLPVYGKAIIPELRAAMKFPGKTGDGRRLKLLHRLDGAAARDLVEQAFEQGSKELKLAAIECLGDAKEDLPLLLEQAGAKAKDVRAAALAALGRVHDEEAVVELFKKVLTGKEADVAALSASQNRHPKLLVFLLQEARAQLDALLTSKDKAAIKTQLARFNEFLSAFIGRVDPGTEALLLDCFNRRDQIQALKGDQVGGAEVMHTIGELMTDSKSPRLLDALASVGSTVNAELFPFVFLAACQSLPAAKVFETYSPLLKVAMPKNIKPKDVDAMKSVALRGCLVGTGADGTIPSRWNRYYYERADHDPNAKKLDPRWLDAAVGAADVELVSHLARPGHTACAAFLLDTVRARIASKSDEHDLAELVETMIQINHPQATDCWIEAMQKLAAKKTNYYGTWRFSPLVAKMPVTSLAKIEAIVPTLPERIIDEVLPHLQALKERAAAAQK